MTSWPQRPPLRRGRRRLFSRGLEGTRSARARRLPAIEELECRRCPSAAAGLLSAAISLAADPNVGLAGQIQGAGSTELYHVPVDADGLLTVQVNPLGFDSRLTVLDGQGNMLIQSEASSPQDPDDHVALHVVPGDYFLMVQGLTGGGSFQLETSFTDANPPSQPLTSYGGSYSVAVADLVEGSSVPDVVIAGFHENQVLVDIGVGDGTFEPPVAIPVGLNPIFVTTADLTGNGIQDIITANLGSNDISILMGNGNGTFQPAVEIPAGQGPSSVAVGDFCGDGHLDLAVTDMVGSDVQILQGNGDGTFTQGPTIPIAGNPISVTTGDFYGNGRTDLATVGFNGNNLTILQDQGGGNFATVQQLAAGALPTGVIAADFDGAGGPELAVASAGDDTVRLFQDQGGQFVPSAVLQAPTSPYALAAADLNGNGDLDLIASSYGAGDISVFAGNGDGTFQAGQNIPVGASTTGIAAADLTGNGRTDLVTTDLITANVYVLLGNGDGTFQVPPQPAIEPASPTVVAADLTGNGIEDLIVPDYSADDLSIFLGRGDGTFRAPIIVPTSLGPWGVAVGDFTGNGILDIAVTDFIADSVTILLGNGDGTFTQGETIQSEVQPSYIVAADLNGNGIDDLVVSNEISEDVSIFYGNGDGTFQSFVSLPAGSQPGNPVVADLDGGGLPDIAVPVNQSSVAVFMATGPQSYAPPVYYPAGPGAYMLAVGALNGDGIPDLVVSNTGSANNSGSVTILMGNGDGTFRAGQSIPLGSTPFAIALADLTGDGTLDIVATSLADNSVMLLMGNGDGTFQPPVEVPAGPEPFGLAVAGFTNDGRLDIAVANYEPGGVTVLLNQGGGTFAPAGSMSSGVTQVAMITTEFTDDSRLDVAVANPLQGTVTVELGNGDGTFTPGETINVGADPTALVAADFNGDGNMDLAVACAGSNDVVVLLGLGDGAFSTPIVLPVGQSPGAIVAGDFFHDGVIDIAVSDEISNNVAVLIGRGDGTFLPAQMYPVGAEPVALVAADLSGNGDEELVTANRTSGDLTVLWALPGGGFRPQTVQYGGSAPSALVAADFNGDGRIDLAVADDQDDEITILSNLGGGVFAPTSSFNIGEAAGFLQAIPSANGFDGTALAATGPSFSNVIILLLNTDGSLSSTLAVPLGVAPIGQVIGDFNGDGLEDIAMVTASSSQLVVRLGAPGYQVLEDPQASAPLPQSAPVVVDWNGDGAPDVFTLNEEGQLLLRLGQPGSPGEFEAPQVISAGPGVSFRDIALVETPYGPVLAALDANNPVVWLFSHAPGPGNLIEVQSVSVSDAALLVSMTAGALTPGGLDDLVLVDRGNDQVILLYQQPDGTFSEEGSPLSVDDDPSDVTIADLNGDGWPDLVVSNTYSGDLSVFYGGPSGFGPEVLLAGGLGAAELVSQNGEMVRQTNDEPMGVTTGVFDASGLTDVVSVQSGADLISLLDGTPGGGLADPSLATSESTGIDPTQVVAADLTGNGLTDLVVLNQGSDDISIFLNNGNGGFTAMPPVDAGNDPTGLAVRDISGNGIPDLLVSNVQGDLLIILGNGDGTFRPYERADQGISLALGDFGGNGQTEYVLSNTSVDQLSIQYGETQSFVQGRSQGIEAPGAVAVADLNGDGNSDIIVLNSGENDMLVYLGLGGNQFEAPLTFFTGTDPVGLTIADLTGNGIPDIIVANAGSNDLSVFIGTGQGANWTLEPRPRLRVGNDPVSTTVADVYGDGIPDIICVDQGSDDVEVLRGVGGGFFNDSDPLVLPAGPSPIRAFVGTFDAAPGQGLAVLDAGSSDLTYYSDVASGTSVPQLIPTGGPDPVAAVMASYLDDGYDDLFIAHQDDGEISFLDGGPDGLKLTDTFSVGQSVQPSDLAVSTGQSGSLLLYVASAARDQVFLVSITLGIGSTVVASPSGSPAQSAAPQASLAGKAGGLTSASGLLTLEEPLMQTEGQVQVSSQAEATSVAVSGGAGQVASALSGFGAMLPQIISPSIAPLTLLVSSLVEMGQVQVSDLMPLDHSALDAVAVLIVVSDAFGEGSVSTGIESMGKDGDDAVAELALASPGASVAGPPVSSRISNLERFLLDLDGPPSDLPWNVLELPVESSGRAWQPEEARPAAVNEPRQPRPRVSTPDAPTGLQAAPDRDAVPAEPVAPAPVVNGGLPEPRSTTETGPGRSDWLRPLGGAFVISSMFLAGRAAWKRRRRGRPVSFRAR